MDSFPDTYIDAMNHIKIDFNYFNFMYLGFVGPLVEIFVKQHNFQNNLNPTETSLLVVRSMYLPCLF